LIIGAKFTILRVEIAACIALDY